MQALEEKKRQFGKKNYMENLPSAIRSLRSLGLEARSKSRANSCRASFMDIAVEAPSVSQQSWASRGNFSQGFKK